MASHEGRVRRAPAPPLALLVAVVLAATTLACAAPDRDDAAALTSATSTGTPGPGGDPAGPTGAAGGTGDEPAGDPGGAVADAVGVDGLGLTEVAWAVNDGLVSVLVRNDTPRVLRRAVLSAQALDSSGDVLATSADTGDQQACCTAVAVPPGATYGFYFAYDGESDAVADVAVGFPDIAWSALDAPRGPTTSAVPVELRADPTGAVVVADLLTVGGAVDDAVVQAVLVDPDDRLVSVVSGRWRCLGPGTPATAYVELFREVPTGTTVRSVQVFNLDAVTDADADVEATTPAPACPPPA